MNKHDLIVTISEKAEISVRQAAQFVDTFVDTVTEALVNDDKVQLIGFGTFETRERAPKNSRNPRTGETIRVLGKTAPVFKAGKALKEAVNK
jgi:DNA-binding protein HU-beta